MAPFRCETNGSARPSTTRATAARDRGTSAAVHGRRTNDYSAGKEEPPAATFLHYYQGLLELIRQKYRNATIFALCPLQYSCPQGAAGKDDPAKWERMLATMRKAVAAVADEKVYLVETGNRSAPWIDCDTETVDGTHPTIEGHKAFATRLHDALASRLPRLA
jgi:lysophospholipase L1-like esterase